jgi:CRISPR-associated protein Csa1
MLHEMLAHLITRAKQLVYAHGTDCVPDLEQQLPHLDLGASGPTDELTQLQLDALRTFEARRITERVAEVLARHPHIGSDAVAMLALPVSVEMTLDGHHLGLSPHLSVDGMSFPSLTVFEVKFGRREEFHRLSTTGYALVLESLFEIPIDLGSVVYVRFVDGRVSLERDCHVIDDELRQVFIEERDEKMRLVVEEIDPGLPDRCPSSCPYLRTCYPVQVPAAPDRHSSANLSRPTPDGVTPAA